MSGAKDDANALQRVARRALSCDSHANPDGTIRRRDWLAGSDRRAFGVFLENFFVARFCDSESAKRAFRRARSTRSHHRVRKRTSCCIQEMPVAQGFLACLTRHCWCFLRAQHREDSSSVVHLFDRAAHLRRRAHQHFLKWHSGFFISLVYSNCSASRIAGCTTLTSHLT